MTDNITALEQRINQFEALIEEMKDVTREAHSALKQLRHERKEIDRLMSTEVKALIYKRVDEVVKIELDKISPTLRKYSDSIYDKVQREVDKIIDLCLGKELASLAGRENKRDLRPELAEKLRDWIGEVIQEE